MSGAIPPTPNKALVDQANAAVAGLTADSSGGGSLFGASSDVLNKPFDVSGLPGLTTKQNPTGRDILQAFLTAGQSDNPAVRNLVASIEYALYQSNYYSSQAPPNLYEVTGHDAEALGRALSDLSNVSSAGASADGSVKAMSLSQFLTSQATLAAAGGPGAPGSATQKVQVVRTPNPADVAAEYEKIATNLEGKRPSQAETQAFVRQYVQSYTQSVTGSTGARYNQLAAAAQVAPAAKNSLTTAYNPATDLAGNLNPNVSQIPTGAGSGNLNPAVQNGSPDPYASASAPPPATDLTDSMATLQQVLAANGATTPDGTQIATAADPESVDTAAENFARNANPTAVHQNDLGNTMNMFLNLITQKMV